MPNKTFYEHFKFSMESLGLKVPMGVFGTVSSASGAIKILSGLVAKYGTRVTVAEVALAVPAGAGGAAVLSQIALVVSNCALAFYVGACIGALAYATGEWSSERLWANNTISGAQIQSVARKHGIPIDGIFKMYLSGGPKSFLAQVRQVNASKDVSRIA